MVTQTHVLYDKHPKTNKRVLKPVQNDNSYQNPNPLPDDPIEKKKEKFDKSEKLKEQVEHVDIAHKPTDRPLIETPDGAVKKLYTPEEIGQAKLKTEQEMEKAKLKGLLKRNTEPLLKTSTVFPFKLFPTKLVIDYDRVNIVNETFFYSERRRSIEIMDLKDVLVDTDLFFGTLKIISVGMGERLTVINFLPKKDALRARTLIQGLITAKRENVNLTRIDDPEIIKKVEELGGIEAI